MTEETQENEITFSEEQQKFVDKLIGKARISAREKATTDSAAAQEQTRLAAEQTKLEADKNWEKLVEMHVGRISELEPLEVQVKVYAELIDGLLKDRIKVLGDAAKKAVEALPENLTAIERLNWLNANESLFTTEGPAPRVGTPAKKVKKQAPGKTPGDLGHKRLRI